MKNMKSLIRLIRCIQFLGVRLGWRYWRIENRALANPFIALDWADACDNHAEFLETTGEGLLARQHREWSAELRSSYNSYMNSPSLDDKSKSVRQTQNTNKIT